MAGRILTLGLTWLGLLLFYLGAGPLVRRIGRRNPKILLYHDCAPAEDSFTAGLDCTTPPGQFAAHLDYLKRHHRVVDVDVIARGEAPEGAVAITFDDGYRSVFGHAFPLLAERGFTARTYLISDVLDNAGLVWVNELNHALRTRPDVTVPLLDEYFPGCPADPSTAIDHCRVNFDAEAMDNLLGRLRASLGYDPAEVAAEARLYMRWSEIEQMLGADMTFGNHTRTHPNLERLSPAEQQREIAGAQEVLAARLPCHSLAYPFGHHSAETAEIARKLGLGSVVEVGGGNRPVDPLALGRVHLSDQSVAGLFARMEVVEPIKAALRRRLRKPAIAA